MRKGTGSDNVGGRRGQGRGDREKREGRDTEGREKVEWKGAAEEEGWIRGGVWRQKKMDKRNSLVQNNNNKEQK